MTCCLQRTLAFLALLLTLSFQSAWAAVACESGLLEGRNFDGKPYRVKLSPAWGDDGILLAFGQDIKLAWIGISNGPDGTARSYEYPKVRINVTRSASTGLVVMLVLEGQEAFFWTWDIDGNCLRAGKLSANIASSTARAG